MKTKCVYCMGYTVVNYSTCLLCESCVNSDFWNTVFRNAWWTSNPEDHIVRYNILPIVKSNDQFYIETTYRQVTNTDAFINSIIMSLNWKNLYFLSLKSSISFKVQPEVTFTRFASDRLLELTPINILDQEYIGGIIVI